MLFLLGCVGSRADSEACRPGADPAIAIGSGVGEYREVRDGGELPLVHGPQGGYHLELGLAAWDLDLLDFASGHFVGRIGGVVRAETDAWLAFECPAGEPAATTWGVRLVYDATPEELDGASTTVDVTVTDATGTEASATSTFVVRDDG